MEYDIERESIEQFGNIRYYRISVDSTHTTKTEGDDQKEEESFSYVESV